MRKLDTSEDRPFTPEHLQTPKVEMFVAKLELLFTERCMLEVVKLEKILPYVQLIHKFSRNKSS